MSELRDLLGIRHPIILGPFGGLSSVELTAAVSDAGGLGSYGLYGYDGARIHETVTALRAATGSPFALNVWLPTGDEVTPDDRFEEHAAALDPFFADVGIARPARPARYLPPLAEQLDAIWEAAPAVLSVVFGAPSRELVWQAHSRGIRVVGTATTVAEALALQRSGVDAIVATGAEAAGHRVSFLRAAEDSLVGLFSLLPQVVDAVDVPVIAAGGMVDGRTMAAAFCLGAEGIQMGTRMVSAAESPVHQNWKDAIVAAKETDTVFLNRFGPGAALRALRTERTSRLERDPGEHGVMSEFKNTQDLYFGGDMEASIALSGQVAGRIDAVKPVAQIISEIVEEFETTMAEMGAKFAARQPA